jgi:hypothetical protein
MADISPMDVRPGRWRHGGLLACAARGEIAIPGDCRRQGVVADKEEVPGSSPGSPTLRKYLQSKVFAEIAPHRRALLELAFGCNMGASGFPGAEIAAHSDRVAAPRRDTNVSPVAARRPGPRTLVSGAGAA